MIKLLCVLLKIFVDELGFLQYAPVLYTSALTKQRVHRVVDLVKYVAEQQAMRVQTSVLNQLVMDAVSINPPPSHKGKQLKNLLYDSSRY